MFSTTTTMQLCDRCIHWLVKCDAAVTSRNKHSADRLSRYSAWLVNGPIYEFVQVSHGRQSCRMMCIFNQCSFSNISAIFKINFGIFFCKINYCEHTELAKLQNHSWQKALPISQMAATQQPHTLCLPVIFALSRNTMCLVTVNAFCIEHIHIMSDMS